MRQDKILLFAQSTTDNDAIIDSLMSKRGRLLASVYVRVTSEKKLALDQPTQKHEHSNCPP